MDKRDVVQGLIGDYAEALVYIFCTMDLASLDATLKHEAGRIIFQISCSFCPSSKAQAKLSLTLSYSKTL